MAVAGIIIGTILVVLSIILVCVTKKDTAPTANTPPPLPSRTAVSSSATPVNRDRRSSVSAGPVPALPQRRNTVNPSSVSLGPHGVRPDQFPCCPWDKNRNLIGKPQLIFWDASSNCYHCLHGHRFKSNGKPI